MGHKRTRKGKFAKPSQQDLENNRVLIHEDHERADLEVRKTYTCILFVILVGIALSFHYPIDVVLAQVTIIPGTDSDDVDVDDDSTESENIDEEVVEEEDVEEEGPSPSPEEVATAPFQSLFEGTLTGSPKITQSVNYSHFIPLTNSPGDQLKVIVDYLVTDQTLVGESVNAVMEVFSVSNQSLIKISSFPDPIIANASGTVQLATTFPDSGVTDVVSSITFTDAEKGIALSEPLTLTLKLGQSSPG